jgi:L-lysine exporter family protein LysE/ArgO
VLSFLNEYFANSASRTVRLGWPLMNSSTLIWPVFLHGLAISFGLIVAIGAQNAFVLRQGLRREHVGSVVFFCALADAALITAGVFGMAQALNDRPQWAMALALIGAVFLAWYGWKALQRMRNPAQLKASEGGDNLSRLHAIAQAAAFTLLNPHVYLDTVVLVGSMGAQQPDDLQIWFVMGASVASAIWFSLLGFGARWLAPRFAHPKAWQVLDGIIGLTMWLLAALMLRHALVSV